MLEVTQSLVDGNEVVVHAGELFEPGAKLPEGVTVRPVMVPGKPAAKDKLGEAKPAQEDKPAAQDKPAAKAPAR